MAGMTYQTPLGPRTFNATNHDADAGEYWGEMVQRPNVSVRRHQGPDLLQPRAAGRRLNAAPTKQGDRADAMTVSLIAAQFLSGLTTAMFLFLIASGLSLVFGVMRVLNFAHGSFYMIGAYMAWQVVTWLQPTGGAFWIAALAAGAKRGLARRHRGAAAVPPSLRRRGALPASVHLRAGADPGGRGQVHLGHRPTLGAPPAGSGRQHPIARHDAALLQSVHHRGRSGNRHRRRPDTEPQLGRADVARRRL